MADATSKPELLSILSACHTKIFLPDEEALTPAMTQAYQAVGLTTAEVQILAKAQKKRDYYYRSVKGRRLFELGLGPAALALARRIRQADQLFLDELVATKSPSEYARALFERRGVAWTGPDPAATAAPVASPVEDAMTVPMDPGMLADLVASESFDGDAATTVPCQRPYPRLLAGLCGERGHHENLVSTEDSLGRPRERRLRGAQRARGPRALTSGAATSPCSPPSSRSRSRRP